LFRWGSLIAILGKTLSCVYLSHFFLCLSLFFDCEDSMLKFTEGLFAQPDCPYLI
jgi:hypothetical protein